MHRVLFLLVALAVSSACSSPPATVPPGSGSGTASTQAPNDPLAATLPLDARVTTGKLDSGLTYYILPHTKPEKRAHLWLAVNAGAVLEDDDQRGVAHFVEHMAFNGTKRFPKQQLVDFLEKTGVRFGADLNAHTSFDETVFQLQIPTDKTETIDRGISVLRDWADGVTFDAGEVDKERGVVLEEWRRGRGARSRLYDKQAPVIFRDSKYAERLTIGKPEIIKTVSRETLLRFYRDWYRPELMAVIAVGDFDAKDIEKRIKTEFSSLAKAEKPRERAVVKIPPHEKTLVTIETDPEQTSAGVAVMSEMPHRPEKSSRDYRRAIAEQLFNAMLNARLDELRRQPDAPFLGAGSATTGLVRTADVFRQTATVRDDGVERGYAALLEEVIRVERHGFVGSELERAKQQLLRSFQQMVKERDKRDASEYAAELVRHFLEEEATPGREAELALAEKFIPTITLEEENALAKSLGAGSRVIAVTGPSTMPKPSTDAMLALDKDVASREIKPYIDAGPSGPLIDKPPSKGTIAKTSTIAELEVTEWSLSNGATVIVKPTAFANDDVRLTGFSSGGTSLVKDEDFVSASFSDDAARQGGLGPFSAVMLRKSLAGKLASASSRVGELEEGVTGRASPADLETMLQLVHLSFTSPRKDKEAFEAWRTREMESVKNRRLSPDQVFYDEMLALTSQGHPRRPPLTPDLYRKIDLDKALAIYKDRFADASDFTFVIVGNVDLDKLKPLVETYLASLPATKRKEKWKDIKLEWPKGVQTKTVKKGSEPRSVLALTFHGKETWSRDADNDMLMLSEALRMRLRQVLREDMGGVYGVQAGGGISRRPRPQYKFNVSFNCAPENVEKLKQAVFDEIKSIQSKGVDDDTVLKIKEARKRSHEVALKDNGFWLRELERAYTFGDDPKLIPDIAAMTEKVTSDRIKAAAKKYLSDKQYVLGILEPETK